MSDQTPTSEPAEKPAGPSRRALLGAAVAAGAAPFVLPGRAEAVVPGPIDPAYEIGPAEPPLTPWERPSLPQADARRLMPRTRSAPGDGERLTAAALPFTFVVHRFPVREVPLELRPYYRTTAVSLTDSGHHDAKGVRMYLRDGRLYNHPVAQAQYGLTLLESYRITGNIAYLDRARQHAQRLWDTRVVRSNAWFYPYPFTFQLHGNKEIYRPPWYSMMAQGQVLSFFVRIYQVTGNANWATAAHNTFNSFRLAPAAGKPWGVYVVNNHLLFEEYPDPVRIRGDRTYNGHTFAAFGLYDYWVWTRNDDALLLLQGAMTTTRDWNASYRSAGWRSKYCLTHGTDSGHYHDVHMGQFAQLYAICGDDYFAQFVDTYYADFPPSAGLGTVRLSAGGHTGVKFNSAGQVTARKTLRLNAVSSAPSSERQKIRTQPGIWYSISGGGLSGYQLQESPPSRYQLGAYAGVSYLLNRPAAITQAAPRAYQVDRAGTMTAVTTTYQPGDSVTIDARAVLNAARHVRLADGPYAGRWLGVAAVTFNVS